MRNDVIIQNFNSMADQHKLEKQDTESQNNFNKEEAYIRAKKRLDKLKGFYWHLGAYLGVNTFLIVMIVWNSGGIESIWHFGTFATPFFWGIGLFFHFLGVFGRNIIFSKEWEDRKIKKYMDRDKRFWE